MEVDISSVLHNDESDAPTNALRNAEGAHRIQQQQQEEGRSKEVEVLSWGSARDLAWRKDEVRGGAQARRLFRRVSLGGAHLSANNAVVRALCPHHQLEKEELLAAMPIDDDDADDDKHDKRDIGGSGGTGYAEARGGGASSVTAREKEAKREARSRQRQALLDALEERQLWEIAAHYANETLALPGDEKGVSQMAAFGDKDTVRNPFSRAEQASAWRFGTGMDCTPVLSVYDRQPRRVRGQARQDGGRVRARTRPC